MRTEIAKVNNLNIYIQDHGILTFTIDVTYEDGTGQGVGGFALDTFDTVKKERVGTSFGCQMIKMLLDFFDGINNAKGQIIQVIGEGDGLSFKPLGIEKAFTHDRKTIIFNDVLKEFAK